MNLKNISLAAAVFSALALSSCKEDKKVVSETETVATTADGEVYTIDAASSNIEWKGYKVVKTDNTSHFGTITLENGEVTVKDGKLESGKFVANMSTINSTDLKDDAEQQGKLNGHLKSADFFDVEKFPNTTYEITKVSDAPAGSDYNTILDGNLTIKEITKPVQFLANVKVNEGTVNIATQPKDISREEFGVVFQIPAANGLIKDDINLQISVNANIKK